MSAKATVFGAQTCKDIGLLAQVHRYQQENLSKFRLGASQNIYEQYSDPFQGLGYLPGEHTIKFESNIQLEMCLFPSKKKNQRRAWLLVVKQKEPTDWVDSMVVAVKVPNKIRICIDTSDFKKEIRKEHFSMTTIEEVVAGLP